MKSFILSLALLIAGYTSSFADFPNVWYKKLPDVSVIGNVRFSHDSKKLLYTGGNIYNQIFDVTTGEVVFDSLPLTSYTTFFSLDDSHLISISGKKIVNYNLLTKVDESNVEQSDKDIIDISISKDQKYFIGTTDDGFRIWDLQSGKIIKSKTLYKNYNRLAIDSTKFEGRVGRSELSNDNTKIYILETTEYNKLINVDVMGNPHYDTKVRTKFNIYDFNTLDSINNLFDEPNLAYMGNYTLSNDCKKVAFRLQNSTNGVIIYDLNTKEEISRLKFDGNTKLTTKFTSDDKYIVTASGTGGDNLSLWEVSTGRLMNKEYETSFETLDISNNSQFICSSVANYLILKKFQTTGVLTPPSEFQILYPNPSNGFVNILVPNQNVEQYSIQIKDLLGSSVMTIPSIIPQNNIINLNISHILNGTYFLNLNSNYSSVTYKLIKE